MAKTATDATGALFPTPVVLVTTIDAEGGPNIITLAWVGVVCSKPFTISVAIRPSRYSHKLLESVPELVVNLPTSELVEKADYCGMNSGRNVDKFKETGLTPSPGTHVKPPLIDECPLSLECRVTNRLALGSHDLFLSEVVQAHIDEDFLDASGKIDYGHLAPFVFLSLDYWTLAKKIGHYGYTK